MVSTTDESMLVIVSCSSTAIGEYLSYWYKGGVLPLIFLSRFSLRHIYDFQPSSHGSSPPNAMLVYQ